VENSKNGEVRNIPLNPYLREILMKLKMGRNPEDYVFTRKDGKRINCIKEAFKAACSKAGITDFRFHDTRHVAASLLAAGGCDIITLQNTLGHKTLAMTQRYAHLIPGKHQRTREIMQDFWKNSGDTKSDTVSYGGK